MIEYVFQEIPGLILPTRNSRGPGGVAEIDIAFWNDGHTDGLRQFDRLIAIECKNWDAAVGYVEIVMFKEKLRTRGQNFGVMVAVSGVTGTSQAQTAAYKALFDAKGEGFTIIVITRSDIDALTSADDLVRLIKEKFLRLCLSGHI
nr:restriction endonuclease [Plantibacter sp. CFBP 8775]